MKPICGTAEFESYWKSKTHREKFGRSTHAIARDAWDASSVNSGPTSNPPPTLNDHQPVWELVIADMKARDQLGRERYGTPLQPFNGRDALQDLYEELLDAEEASEIGLETDEIPVTIRELLAPPIVSYNKGTVVGFLEDENGNQKVAAKKTGVSDKEGDKRKPGRNSGNRGKSDRDGQSKPKSPVAQPLEPVRLPLGDSNK